MIFNSNRIRTSQFPYFATTNFIVFYYLTICLFQTLDRSTLSCILSTLLFQAYSSNVSQVCFTQVCPSSGVQTWALHVCAYVPTASTLFIATNVFEPHPSRVLFSLLWGFKNSILTHTPSLQLPLQSLYFGNSNSFLFSNPHAQTHPTQFQNSSLGST